MSQLRYEKLHPEFGASLRGVDLGKPLTPDLIQGLPDLRLPYGVLVALRSTDAAANGLETGDVVFSVNGAPVKTLEELRGAVDGLKVHQPAVLQIQREDKLRFVTIEIE